MRGNDIQVPLNTWKKGERKKGRKEGREDRQKLGSRLRWTSINEESCLLNSTAYPVSLSSQLQQCPQLPK